QRQEAAAQAESLVDRCTLQFMDSLKSLDAVETIRQYRETLEILRQQELERALQQLQAGGNAEEILQRMSRNLINKVMHQPTVQLRQAAEQGRLDQLELAQQLLGLAPAEKSR
ncbi:hypothetical protein RZS08_11455, partial [Arthrospira platensis SPKY1]|nr:hypothetical protein [Arthrospira platensis SPKY1]